MGDYVAKESLFNSSFESLRRIQEILGECNRDQNLSFIARSDAEKVTSLKSWWLNLKNLYKEIDAKLGTNEVKRINSLFNKSAKIKINNSSKRQRDGSMINEINRKAYSKKWATLYNVELALRRYATKKGLLIKDKETAMRMMEQ